MEFITTCAVVVAGLVYARRLVCVVPKGALKFVLLLPCVAVNVGVPTLCMSPLGPSRCSGVRGGGDQLRMVDQLQAPRALRRSRAVGGVFLAPPRFSRSARFPSDCRTSARAKVFDAARRTRRPQALLPRTPQALPPRRRVRRPHPAHSRGVQRPDVAQSGLRAVADPCVPVMSVSSLVAAGVFDLHLLPHFDKPFLAASISEFWAER